MAAHILRDSQGRITSYKATSAPSQTRLRAILSQARQQRATAVGIVGDVKEFQGYEKQKIESSLIRAYRKGDTPQAMRDRITGPGSQSGEAFILRDIASAPGVEYVSGLQGFQINFYYGSS